MRALLILLALLRQAGLGAAATRDVLQHQPGDPTRRNLTALDGAGLAAVDGPNALTTRR